MVNLNSLAGQKSSGRITAKTTSAMYSQLLSGRNYRGDYNQDVAYSAGDVVIVSTSDGAELLEAVTDIASGSAFDADYWATPAIGSPFTNSGSVVLSNSQEYPLNDSSEIVTLKREMATTDYIVLTSCNDTGVDEVEIYDKTVNTFTIRFWGTMSLAKINWAVLKEN